MARTAIVFPALAVLAVGLAGPSTAGAAEGHAQAPPTAAAAARADLGEFKLKPDIRVDAVWLGKPSPGDVFTPLGHDPTLGEGTETMLNPPLCEYTWPLSVGAKAVLSYVSHTPGSHVYRCAADIGAQVSEKDESNNANEVAFKTLMTAFPIVKDRKAIGRPLPDPGPRLVRQ